MADAAINVAVLVLAINLPNPARPNFALVQLVSFAAVFGTYVLPVLAPSAEYPLRAVLISGTWEQVRLLTSFLFLRIAAGGLLQSIVLNVSQRGDWRIGILPSNCNLTLDDSSATPTSGPKPKNKFELNVSLGLILAGAATVLATGLVGGVFVALVKARDAFAA